MNSTIQKKSYICYWASVAAYNFVMRVFIFAINIIKSEFKETASESIFRQNIKNLYCLYLNIIIIIVYSILNADL